MKMPKKRTTAQRRAKQAAKRHSALSNKSGKQPAGAKAYVGPIGAVRGLKPQPPPESQLVKIEKPIYGGAFLARVEGKDQVSVDASTARVLP